jgi:hypothetical protein
LNKRNFIAVVVAFLCWQLSFSQVDDVKRIVKHLCSPELHGRGYVNEGDSIAAEFIAREFQTIGLKTIGKSYFQALHFPVNTFPKNAQFTLIKNDGSTEELELGRTIIAKENAPSYHGTLHYRTVPTHLKTACKPSFKQPCKESHTMPLR